MLAHKAPLIAISLAFTSQLKITSKRTRAAQIVLTVRKRHNTILNPIIGVEREAKKLL